MTKKDVEIFHIFILSSIIIGFGFGYVRPIITILGFFGIVIGSRMIFDDERSLAAQQQTTSEFVCYIAMSTLIVSIISSIVNS